jgi:hypothetical protein
MLVATVYSGVYAELTHIEFTLSWLTLSLPSIDLHWVYSELTHIEFTLSWLTLSLPWADSHWVYPELTLSLLRADSYWVYPDLTHIEFTLSWLTLSYPALTCIEFTLSWLTCHSRKLGFNLLSCKACLVSTDCSCIWFFSTHTWNIHPWVLCPTIFHLWQFFVPFSRLKKTFFLVMLMLSLYFQMAIFHYWLRYWIRCVPAYKGLKTESEQDGRGSPHSEGEFSPGSWGWELHLYGSRHV